MPPSLPRLVLTSPPVRGLLGLRPSPFLIVIYTVLFTGAGNLSSARRERDERVERETKTQEREGAGSWSLEGKARAVEVYQIYGKIEF